MAMLRLKEFSTTTTAGGTAAGELAVADTSGLSRRCRIVVTKDAAAFGAVLEVVRVVSATLIIAKWGDAGDRRSHLDLMNLSAVPTGSNVYLEEQWVQDLYQDDAPDTIAIPVKVV